MAHSVGKRRLLAPQDALGQDAVRLKRLADEVFAHVVSVHLQLGIDAHRVMHKRQVAKGHARLQRVDGDAPIGAQHVIHVQFADALLRLVLERAGVRRVIGILVAEQLVGDFAREQHADVRMLVNVLAHQIHAHARADGRDVVGTQQFHHRGQRVDDVLTGDDDLGMIASDVFRHLTRVLEVDRVLIHTYREGADGLFQLALRDGAHQRGIQTAREQEAQRRIRVQTLFHALDEQVVQMRAHGFFRFHHKLIHVRRVGVADEFTVRPVAARRERQDCPAKAHEVLRLAGKGDAAVREHAVIERADADGIARRNKAVLFGIVENQRKFRVQRAEHIRAVFAIKRKQNLTVGFAPERIRFHQALAHRAEAVKLAVAHDIIAVHLKGLHAALVKPHDRQPVEAQIAARHLDEPAHIRPAGDRPFKTRRNFFHRNRFAQNTQNRTHKKGTSIFSRPFIPLISGRRPLSVVPPDLLLNGFYQTPAVVT